MLNTALMAGTQELVIDAPAVMEERARVVRPQQGGGLLKSAARQNVAESDLLAYHHPQPKELCRHVPAGLIHAIEQAALGGIAQRVPRSLAPASHAIDGAADRAAIHPQVKGIFEDRGHVGMRHG